jgi:2-polyprenyl-6-methoxyphenol hydroxylase-like FAD-dependent oxidoreductase
MTEQRAPERVSILILGGGVVGLSAALFLLHQGVRPLLVERHRGTSIHPRSRGINARSGELFRQVGVFEEIRSAGAALQPAVGAYSAETLVQAIEALPRRAPDAPQPHLGMGTEAMTPTPTCRCTQDLMEPLLRARAVERGADVRFGTEVESFDQDDAGVTAVLVERESGVRREVRADYMIAADGAGGRTRERLGIATTGRGAMGNLLNVLLRVDLTELVRGREFSLCNVENEHVRGTWVAIDNHTRWALHIVYAPERGESPSDFPPERCAELARRALGLPSADIEVLGVLPWQPSVRVAQRFQAGRVFLAGDAAHQMPPWGGQGANTGIAEVHNLAWKLAAVLGGQAAPSLLETYNLERQPIGLYVAETSGTLGGRDGLLDVTSGTHPLAKIGPRFVLGLNYRYQPGEEPLVVDDLDGRPGTRVPHAWVEKNGERSSTLDLFGKEFVLISGDDAWKAAANALVSARRRPLRAVAVGDMRGAEAWAKQVGLAQGGALLVRPDGFVAWRTADAVDDGVRALDHALGAVLGR